MERASLAVSGAAGGAPEGTAPAVLTHFSKEHGKMQTVLAPRGELLQVTADLAHRNAARVR